MYNLYGKNMTVFGYDLNKLSSRLNGLLLALKACVGWSCTHPWETLHPQGNVHNLKQAMDPRYDDFYLFQQHQVTFSECGQYYIPSLEGVLHPAIFSLEPGPGMA